MTWSRALDWLGVVAVCATAALTGLLELFLVPVYAGSTLVPIAVLFAVASNIALPRLGRALVPTTAASVLPFAAWLLVVVIVGWYARPEGDVVLPGGGAVEWVGVGVSLGGALAGTITIVLSTPRPQPATRRPVDGQPVNG